MAWTFPSTRATGDLITAAIWNTDLVNNLRYLGTDGGWQTVADGSMTNSWVNGTPAFAYRIQGNVARLRGVVKSGGSGIAALTLPSFMWPVQAYDGDADVVGFANAGILVSTAGVLTPEYASAGSGVSCDNQSWTVD